jgi:hypothetical protein
MLTNNSLLTDISQLDELNKEVWADSVRAKEITQRVELIFGDISWPSQNTVNEPESKATDTLTFGPNGAMRLVYPKRSIF